MRAGALERDHHWPLEDAAESQFCYMEFNNLEVMIRDTLTMITASPGGIEECSLEKCWYMRGS